MGSSVKNITVDVIIPVYKPDIRFGKLLAKLSDQTVMPENIFIVNTDKKEWEKSGGDFMVRESGAEELVKIRHIRRSEFDHGETRNIAAASLSSKFFILMTQDAVPANDTLIEELLAPMDETVKLTYARQLPSKNAGEIEKITRYFNYPETSMLKTSGDLGRLGIKTYFCSNVCAAYERRTFERLRGFEHRAIFNEDMIYAAKLIKAGYGVRYCAAACVFHSHNYSFIQQFRRNFDNGVSQAQHPEIFKNIKNEKEGIALVKTTAKVLLKHGKFYLLPILVWQSGWKYIGFLAGKKHEIIPRTFRKIFSFNCLYWNER